MGKPMRRCHAIACRNLIPFDHQYCAQHIHLKREKHKVYDAARNREDGKYRKVYQSPRWRTLRQQALLRDDYICQNCLINGEYKPAEVVHHKIELKEDITKAFDMNNLVSWCHQCHNTHHKGTVVGK